MARKRVIYIGLDDETIEKIDRLTQSSLGKLERSAVIRELIKIGLRKVAEDAEELRNLVKEASVNG